MLVRKRKDAMRLRQKKKKAPCLESAAMEELARVCANSTSRRTQSAAAVEMAEAGAALSSVV